MEISELLTKLDTIQKIDTEELAKALEEQEDLVQITQGKKPWKEIVEPINHFVEPIEED